MKMNISNSNKAKDKLLFTLICFGILIGIFIKVFVLDILTIQGDSMNPSLVSGKKIIINKMAYGLVKPFSQEFIFTWNTPQKGDIVTFLHDNKIVVKRCVLTGGDYLEILQDSEYSKSYMIIEGRKIPLSKNQAKIFYANQTVPQGFIFVLGDNDSNSIDSREYGFVATKNITGKVIEKK